MPGVATWVAFGPWLLVGPKKDGDVCLERFSASRTGPLSFAHHEDFGMFELKCTLGDGLKHDTKLFASSPVFHFLRVATINKHEACCQFLLGKN